MALIFGDCDCCPRRNVVLHPVFSFCGDTAACAVCRGWTPEDMDEAGEISLEIERLRPKAEIGEHWAYISALEARYVELTGVNATTT